MIYGKRTIDLITESEEGIMLCPICNNPLIIAKSRLEFVNDHTPDAVTEAYRCLDMVCITSDINHTGETCANYAGADLQAPNVIVETIKHKEV